MELRVSADAQAQIDELPAKDKNQIWKSLQRLANWPQISGVKTLTGEWRGFSRLRSGNYRLIFRVFDREKIIEVVRVALRRDVYE